MSESCLKDIEYEVLFVKYKNLFDLGRNCGMRRNLVTSLRNPNDADLVAEDIASLIGWSSSLIEILQVKQHY